jgi:hypothetical protein
MAVNLYFAEADRVMQYTAKNAHAFLSAMIGISPILIDAFIDFC